MFDQYARKEARYGLAMYSEQTKNYHLEWAAEITDSVAAKIEVVWETVPDATCKSMLRLKDFHSGAPFKDVDFHFEVDVTGDVTLSHSKKTVNVNFQRMMFGRSDL